LACASDMVEESPEARVSDLGIGYRRVIGSERLVSKGLLNRSSRAEDATTETPGYVTRGCLIDEVIHVDAAALFCVEFDRIDSASLFAFASRDAPFHQSEMVLDSFKSFGNRTPDTELSGPKSLSSSITYLPRLRDRCCVCVMCVTRYTDCAYALWISELQPGLPERQNVSPSVLAQGSYVSSSWRDATLGP